MPNPRPTRRSCLLATLLVGAGFFAPQVALAASLPVTSDQFGTMLAPVTTCDTDGVTATYSTLLLTVSSVTVSGIADGSATGGQGRCDGKNVEVTLLGANGTPIPGATGTQTNSGDANTADNSVSVLILAPPLTATITGVRISIR